MTVASAVASSRKGASKYLTFQLGPEEYAIQVLKVREIVKVQHITSVPEMPANIKGVINLRGKVIPVIDLRLKFGMPELEYGQRTCIIVVQLNDGSSAPMGVIVDQVNEVLNLQESDIQQTPDFGTGVETPYILGMAKVKDKVRILLDISRVLATSDVVSVQTGAE
jgi:purine-binding chemotaxis protein CheW